MDPTQFSISAPIIRENTFVPKHYVQYLKYQNETIMLQSSEFNSNGPKVGLNNGYQLLTTFNDETRTMLTEIQKFAIDNLQLPPPILEKWQKSEESRDTIPFKLLYEGNNLFIKLAHNVQLFNMDHFENGHYQPFPSNPPLGAGTYIALVEVPLVFIGSHNSNPKVASLQLRITQLVYRPKLMSECRIIPHLSSLKPVDGEITLEKTDAKTSRKRTVNRKAKKSNDSLQEILDSVSVASSSL